MSEQAFIPERYIMMLELLVHIPNHGKGILIPAEKVSEYIRLGRIHANVVINREVVYIIEKSGMKP